jgi:hypothetical protein
MRKIDSDFYSGRLFQNIQNGFENRWKNPGDEDNTNIPSYVANSYENASRRYMPFYVYSDINVVSASYIKLRDLSLSYTLPKSVCDRLSLGTVRVRMQASNLFYWAANKDGIDPEASDYSNGVRMTRFGPSYSAGVTINFR